MSQPAAASLCAMARPMPREAPVTSATFPARVPGVEAFMCCQARGPRRPCNALCSGENLTLSYVRAGLGNETRGDCNGSSTAARPRTAVGAASAKAVDAAYEFGQQPGDELAAYIGAAIGNSQLDAAGEAGDGHHDRRQGAGRHRAQVVPARLAARRGLP